MNIMTRSDIHHKTGWILSLSENEQQRRTSKPTYFFFVGKPSGNWEYYKFLVLVHFIFCYFFWRANKKKLSSSAQHIKYTFLTISTEFITTEKDISIQHIKYFLSNVYLLIFFLEDLYVEKQL